MFSRWESNYEEFFILPIIILPKYKSNDVVKNYVDYLIDSDFRTIVQILFLLLTEKTRSSGSLH